MKEVLSDAKIGEILKKNAPCKSSPSRKCINVRKRVIRNDTTEPADIERAIEEYYSGVLPVICKTCPALVQSLIQEGIDLVETGLDPDQQMVRDLLEHFPL